MSKTVQFGVIQLSISSQRKCKYTVYGHDFSWRLIYGENESTHIERVKAHTLLYSSKTFLFQAIQFSQTVPIQTIQFSIRMQFSSI